MIPFMSNDEILLLTTLLEKSKIYFEFGSGGSTYLALSCANILRIYSVDTDKKWLDKFEHPKLDKIYIDVGSVGSFGDPLDQTKIENWKLYSESITKISSIPDTVLIDGRFRVACGIKTWEKINDSTNVLIHDFHRKEYQVLLELYNIIEKSNTLVVLRKKNSDIDIDKMYNKYKNVKS